VRFYIMVFLLFLSGCGISSQSVDTLSSAADSYLSKAKEAGAEELARNEFQDAQSLLVKAKNDPTNKKEKKILLQRSAAKARLAEAMARQTKAERELAKNEIELGKIESHANDMRMERQSAESTLKQLDTNE